MKILVIIEYFSFETGGATLYTTRIIQELTTNGYEVSVIHGEKNSTLPIAGIKHVHAFNNFLGINDHTRTSQFAVFKETVAAINPDLIYLHQIHNPNVFSWLAAHWPTVRFEHGLQLMCPSGRRLLPISSKGCLYKAGCLCQLHAFTQRCMPRNVKQGLYRIIQMKRNFNAHRKIACIQVASVYIKNLLIKQGMDTKKIVILPYFTDIPDTVERHVDWQMPEIVFVGRLIPEKGVRCLLDALKKINKPLLVSFLGTGPLLEELKTRTNNSTWQHRFKFYGWINNTQIGEFYKRAALVAVPSLWMEPFGIIGIEAMAHGVPAVAFDVGGISDWLHHGKTGLLVPRGDVDRLAEAIEYLAFNREINLAWGKAAREIAQNKYNKKLHMEKLCALFAETVQQYRKEHP